jgi:cytochrome b involved in lipid metabolism
MKLSLNQKTFTILATLLWNNEVYGFAPIHSRTVTASTSTTRIGVASSITTNGDTSVSTSVGTSANLDPSKAWDCDDDANCVLIEACDEEICRTTLDVRIHGEWYDLSGWRKAHPAGMHWIDWYDGRDATEVMDAFHSQKARGMWQRLPKSNKETAMQLEIDVAPDSQTQINFRELREQLETDGWWERDYKHEATLLGIWGSIVVGAVATAHTIPAVSICLTGLAMTNAGWIGHDYIHGVDKFTDKMRMFVAVAGGLGPTWWSDKHNKHHALSKLF